MPRAIDVMHVATFCGSGSGGCGELLVDEIATTLRRVVTAAATA